MRTYRWNVDRLSGARHAVCLAVCVVVSIGGATARGVLSGLASASVTRPAPTTSTTTKVVAPKEVNPAGDIPDNQAFVPYTRPAGGGRLGYSVNVPEGWARTDGPSFASFTDKLNTIRMEATLALNAPTTASALATELAAIKSTDKGVTGGKVTVVARKAGPGVLLRYRRDSAANEVTGKVVREDVERYEFWRGNTQVTLTLSGPVGADNVDPWKIVTDSFKWK